MPTTAIVDFLAEGQDGAFEGRSYLDADGNLLAWRAASVRDGGSDANEVYQVDSDGNIFLVEDGDDDDGNAVALAATTKRYQLDGISMLHDLYVRLEAVSADTLTLSVSAGGSEYGTITQEYEVDASGAGDKEVRVRLHRELLGTWAQITLGGDVSNRPEVREMTLRFIPFRGGRVSA
jgi:hypothetical protein